MKTEIEIRQCTEREARRFFMAYLKETYPHHGDVPPLPENVDFAVTKFLDPKFSFVALVEGTPVGAAFFQRMDLYFKGMKPIAQDCGFWVEPEFRGAGIAGDLANHAMEQLRKAGVQRVIGCFNEENKSARHFISKLGWNVSRIQYEVDLTPTASEGKA